MNEYSLGYLEEIQIELCYQGGGQRVREEEKRQGRGLKERRLKRIKSELREIIREFRENMFELVGLYRNKKLRKGKGSFWDGEVQGRELGEKY